jgi:hypothetical protein
MSIKIFFGFFFCKATASSKLYHFTGVTALASVVEKLKAKLTAIKASSVAIAIQLLLIFIFFQK